VPRWRGAAVEPEAAEMADPGTRTRDALAALADHDLVASLLDTWLTRAGRPPASAWRREYARFHPGQDPWAVCLYEASGGLLLRIDALVAPERADFVHEAIGPVRVAEFPNDPALPGLAEVMAMLDRVQVVRYRPGKRCTLRGFAAGAERFVKVIPGGERIYAEALKVWGAFKGGALSMVVAEPYGWHAPTSSFWQGVVPGRSVASEVFGHEGDRYARRFGHALGELASSKLVPALTSPASEHLHRTSHAITRVARSLPALEARLAQIRTELERRHAALPERALVPIHGALHVDQWFVQGSRLGLIDFDRFALGDPEFDLATLLADFDTDRAQQLPVATIEAAFIEGFESRGVPIDRKRAELYGVHQRLSRLTHAAWAVRPDAAHRAERHLQTVECMLEA
jgi:Phosphotransferase enzyme family